MQAISLNKAEIKNEKFKDWKVGPNYQVQKILGQGSYG